MTRASKWRESVIDRDDSTPVPSYIPRDLGPIFDDVSRYTSSRDASHFGVHDVGEWATGLPEYTLHECLPDNTDWYAAEYLRDLPAGFLLQTVFGGFFENQIRREPTKGGKRHRYVRRYSKAMRGEWPTALTWQAP